MIDPNHKEKGRSKGWIFLDKDGTILKDVPYNVDPHQMAFEEGAARGLKRLDEAGFRLVVVSNQSGVARGYFTEDALLGVRQALNQMLMDEAQVELSGFYYCPHHPDGSVPDYAVACECRKPEPGMLLEAARDLNIQLSEAWMIGDILNDIEAGCRAGCRTILIDNGHETEWEPGPYRKPDFIAGDLEAAAGIILSHHPSPAIKEGNQA